MRPSSARRSSRRSRTLWTKTATPLRNWFPKHWISSPILQRPCDPRDPEQTHELDQQLCPAQDPLSGRGQIRRAGKPLVQCPSCEQMLFHRDLRENLNVCGNCGHHMRLPARERLEILFDGGSFTEIELPENVTDPLKFRDRKRYSDRLRDSPLDRTNRRDHRRARRNRRPQDSHRSIRFFLHGRFDGDCRG